MCCHICAYVRALQECICIESLEGVSSEAIDAGEFELQEYVCMPHNARSSTRMQARACIHPHTHAPTHRSLIQLSLAEWRLYVQLVPFAASREQSIQF